MSQSELPLGNPETFLGECAEMRMDELKDKVFLVSINSGDRENGKFIQETAHGPYNFLEMVEEVATMYYEFQHHASVYMLSKDKREPCQWLGSCVIDYIEARHVDIITDAFIGGALDKEYTCRPSIISAADEDPRLQKKIEDHPDEDMSTVQ
jgi:hypothetical protein